MKAIILAAGKGTRMRELTEDIPKPMICVHGKPILEHIIDGLKNNGIKNMCIIIGYKGDTVKNYFGNGSNHGISIEYRTQSVPDGTGKAPELAKDFVGTDDFLLTYGDILVKEETYADMLACHTHNAEAGVIAVTKGDDVTKGGLNLFDTDFFLKQILEKPTPSHIEELRTTGILMPHDPIWSNAGIYIFKPALFEFTARIEKSPRNEYELTEAINKLVAAGHCMKGMHIKTSWVDVRDPEILSALEKQ